MNTSLVSSSSSSIFNFNAEHNGVPCIVSTRPEDQGSEQQVWFTRQMLCCVFGVKSLNTIDNHVDALVKRGVVTDIKNLTSVMMPDSHGRECVKTTLYDLKVFNLLAMRLDTDRAWEVKEKFNDILVKEETKKFPIPETLEDALILAGQQMKLAKEEERKRIQTEKECAELKRTKAFISTKRESTAMGKLGGTTKALICEREKNTKLLKENIDLIKEKEELKIRLSESDEYKTIRQMTNKLKPYILTDTKSLQRLGKEMTKISMEMGFKVIQVPDDRYPKVNSYHIEVWRETLVKLNNDPLFLIDIRK